MIYLPRKPQMIQAVQFRGDFNDPDVKRLGVSPIPYQMGGQCQCGQSLYQHGMVNGSLICPGMYILFEGSTITNLMGKSNFEAIYKPLWDENEIEEIDVNKNREEDTNKETRSEEEGGST